MAKFFGRMFTKKLIIAEPEAKAPVKEEVPQGMKSMGE